MMSLMLFAVYGAGMFGPQADLIPKRELSSVKENTDKVSQKMEEAKNKMEKAKHGMEEANRKLQSVKEEAQVKSGCSACSCGK